MMTNRVLMDPSLAGVGGKMARAAIRRKRIRRIPSHPGAAPGSRGSCRAGNSGSASIEPMSARYWTPHQGPTYFIAISAEVNR